MLEPNSIVIVSLINPKEKFWGQLVSLSPAGVTIRGVEIYSFDDFVRQIRAREESTMGLTMIFYPMHRVERIAMDEPSGSIPSMADRFREKVGVSLLEFIDIESSSTSPSTE